MAHKNHATLENELERAGKLVTIGGKYFHYKHPNQFYTVIGFGIQEATDTVAVLYQADYNPALMFIRDLQSWLEKPDATTDRFTLVE